MPHLLSTPGGGNGREVWFRWISLLMLDWAETCQVLKTWQVCPATGFPCWWSETPTVVFVMVNQFFRPERPTQFSPVATSQVKGSLETGMKPERLQLFIPLFFLPISERICANPSGWRWHYDTASWDVVPSFGISGLQPVFPHLPAFGKCERLHSSMPYFRQCQTFL